MKVTSVILLALGLFNIFTNDLGQKIGLSRFAENMGDGDGE